MQKQSLQNLALLHILLMEHQLFKKKGTSHAFNLFIVQCIALCNRVCMNLQYYFLSYNRIPELHIYRYSNVEVTRVRKIMKIYRALVSGVINEDEVYKCTVFLPIMLLFQLHILSLCRSPFLFLLFFYPSCFLACSLYACMQPQVLNILFLKHFIFLL